ncbi:MAG: 16S rRNA (cytosine(1402)-N(4))-methyltransferase RsmH [Muribaculaceae bacterium]
MEDNTTQHIPYHTPALFNEAIDALDIKPDGIYIDATFGGGGHSRGIIDRLGPDGRLLGFDQDLDAIANALPDERFTFVRSNFRYIPNFLRFHGIDKADGILADLGVSFHHFDDAERGFSFRADAPLDMRMNRAAGQTAADLVNTLSDQELTVTLRLGSDLQNPARIARAIAKARADSPILTTTQLADTVRPLLNPRNEKKELAQVFQALRIAVNHETDALVDFLLNAAKVLRPGGRLAVITYHSLEDRMVKALMKCGNIEGNLEKDFFGNVNTPWTLITRSPIVPSAEEIEANPRARSAKLRVAALK